MMMYKANTSPWSVPSFHESPLVMGVLNLTPNSFYDGGQYLSVDAAYDRAHEMIREGVDMIDIGGESSRPGAETISVQEELDRVMPLIERIRKGHPIALSIDTSKPQVMQAAINAGVSCINDIQALRTPGSMDVAVGSDVLICLMHMQGTPASMQVHPHYEVDVVANIDQFFEQRIQACLVAGIERERLILDPGFGFGKTVQHNLQLVRRLNEFQHHGLPVMLGVSRKSTIGDILQQSVDERLIGGLALGIYAILAGASILRTHDVKETKQMVTMIQRLYLSDREGT